MSERIPGPACLQINYTSISDSGTMCRATSVVSKPIDSPPHVTAAPYQCLMPESERQVIRQVLHENEHELFVLSIEQMDRTIQGNKEKLQKADLASWEQLKGAINLGASYTATGKDLLLLKKLTKDLGSIGAQAYVKTIGGTPHIILKGYPGLREILTSPKYGINHTKVIKMGLGKAGAIKSAKAGGLLTIVLLTTYRVADYLLTDEATLSELIGTLATDVVKVGISVGASIAAATAVAAMTTIAIGPLVAAIAVGVVASWALDKLDQEFDITESFIEGLEAMAILAANKKKEVENQIKAKIDETERAITQSALQIISVIIDEAVETSVELLEREARKTLRKLLYGLPSLN